MTDVRHDALPVQPCLPGLGPDSAVWLAATHSLPPPGSLARADAAETTGSVGPFAERIGWYLLGVLCGCAILYLVDLARALSG